jgi:hypothetical protein
MIVFTLGIIHILTRVGSSGFWHRSTTTPGCVLLPLLRIRFRLKEKSTLSDTYMPIALFHIILYDESVNVSRLTT